MTKKQLVVRLRNLEQAIDSIGGTKEPDDLRRYLDKQIVDMLNRVKSEKEFNV